MKTQNQVEEIARVSFFNNVKHKPGKSLDINEVLHIIKTDESVESIIQMIRSEPDKGKADSIKKTLAAIHPPKLKFQH